MLRVNAQERNRRDMWDLFVAGAAKKKETFERFLRRTGAQVITPMPVSEQREASSRTIERVKRKLGRFYRPPT